jgi:uncharacterized membrane protein YqjE
MDADKPTEAAHKARPASLRELLRRLIADVVTLISSEANVAVAELRRNIAGAGNGLALIGLGAMLVSVALLCLLGATVAFLAQFVGIPLAALIVAAVAAVIAGVLIAAGLKQLKSSEIMPRKALARLRRDAALLKGEQDGI